MRKVRVLYDKNHHIIKKIPLENFHYVKAQTNPSVKLKEEKEIKD